MIGCVGGFLAGSKYFPYAIWTAYGLSLIHIFTVENDDAFAQGKEIAKEEGILVGISAGAALHAAIELAKRPENKGKNIVALLPDTGDRYYSTPLFGE